MIASFKHKGLRDFFETGSARRLSGRITFGWEGRNVVDVDLEDYH
jgi:plasmid maintenance system killer protein